MKRVIPCLLMIAACGGDDGGNTRHDAATVDMPVSHVDAPTDSKTFLDAPPGTATLTLKNYANWCNIGIDGATPMQMLTATKNLAPGTYNVAASGAAGFEIEANMWHHTDGDTNNTGENGNQVAGTSTAMVTMGTTAKCVWVCCQFDTTHMGCGALAEQCN